MVKTNIHVEYFEKKIVSIKITDKNNNNRCITLQFLLECV